MVAEEKGSISIHTENIFPIIKKFLYSDHEIFLRELVSNAVDASQKLKRLAAIGEFNGELGELKVTVSLDKEAKTITISDNGIGMSAEEIKKYINQIAFSGATEFVEKYKDKGDAKELIIGNFGLGFYSSFMVAKEVEIITKSFREDEPAARWICDGSTEFSITAAEKAERGTDIILHVSEDSEEFLDSYRLRSILTKYCKFLPITVEFEGDAINNTQPIWTKAPADLTDEDYKNFYKELYPMAAEPLFWIHLNVDYPFNLTGILYFPKVKNEMEFQRDKIQLYSRQVFITDEVKDVVPEFLMLLHGVIDSPDIPLNVSRSFLQADSNVKKINNYITRKVADKLGELFNNDRTGYEEKWESIGLFVKYGLISDDKFYDKAKDFGLVKNVNGKYFTFNEYKEHIAATQTNAEGNTVWLYTNDPGTQGIYIEQAEKRGYDVLQLDTVIDTHVVSHLEQKLEKVSFKRIDADIADRLIDKGEETASVLSEAETEKVKSVFATVSGNSKPEGIKVEALAAEDLPVQLTQDEFMRRMRDMYANNPGMAMFGAMGADFNIVVNGNSPIINRIATAESTEVAEKLARQTYDLALLSQNKLSGTQLSQFIQRSLEYLNN